MGLLSSQGKPEAGKKTQQCKIDRVVTVRNDGLHNGFPGLCAWRGWYYLAFRTAYEHNPSYPRGYITVLSTDDPHEWGTATEHHVWSGGDDRDPFFIPSDDRLIMIFGSYTTADTELLTGHHQIKALLLGSHSTFLRGHNEPWTWPQTAYRWGYWPWSGLEIPTAKHDKRHFLSAAYHAGEAGDNCTVHLIRSVHGTKWFNYGLIRDEYDTSLTEPVLFVDPDDPEYIYCIARREALDETISPGEILHPVVGRMKYGAKEGFRWGDWIYIDTPMHPGAVVQTPLGFVVGARTEKKDRAQTREEKRTKGLKHAYNTYNTSLLPRHETTLRTLDPQTGKTTPLTTLPSYGDCGYPSMVYDKALGQLLVAYYSQHEAEGLLDASRPPIPAGIYLACVPMDREPMR